MWLAGKFHTFFAFHSVAEGDLGEKRPIAHQPAPGQRLRCRTQRSLRRYPEPPSSRRLWVPLGSHTRTFCLIIRDYYIFPVGAWCRRHSKSCWGEVSLCSTRDPMLAAPRDAGLCRGAQRRGSTSRWCRGGFSKQELQERAEGGWILRGECRRCSDAPRNQRGILGVSG